jgi:hypothetical protein
MSGLDLAYNTRNKYQESSGGGGGRTASLHVRLADNLTVIHEPLWESCLTNLWGPIACYRDYFTFTLLCYGFLFAHLSPPVFLTTIIGTQPI